jgi:predicted DNA-binding protein
METKDKQFHMRLSPRENNALDALAKREGVSKSNYLRNYLRNQAKKKGIPV